MRCLDGITVSGYKFEQTIGNGEGQGSLVYCSPWGHEESDTTYRQNNNNKMLGKQSRVDAKNMKYTPIW